MYILIQSSDEDSYRVKQRNKKVNFQKKLKKTPKKRRKASIDSDSSLSGDYDENVMADYCTVVVSYDELVCSYELD